MARLIERMQTSHDLIRVVYERDWNEYQCIHYVSDGDRWKHCQFETYYTDDREDALATAATMLRQCTEKRAA